MQINPVIIALIPKLIVGFAARVHNFQILTEMMLFAKDPFTLDAGGEFAAKTKQVLMLLDEAPCN